MGASDWAGTMSERLNREFGTKGERNLRVTSLIRWFVSDPRYQDISDDPQQSDLQSLIDDLPEILREQPGDTLEQRWNHLMYEWGYQEKVDAGVYLVPWEDYDDENYDPQVTRSPPNRE